MNKIAEVYIREPNLKDAKGVNLLLNSIPNLDRNSEYLYMLLCAHFSKTCRVAIADEQVVGLCTAYMVPDKPGHIFIWQIGVDPNYTRRGIAKGLLFGLMDDLSQKVTHLHATISPSNTASRKLFDALAHHHNTQCTWSEFLLAEHFIGDHEDEELLTIMFHKEEQ